MGFVSARELAAKGYHTIIACRSAERGQAALQKLQAENPQGSFQLESVDLASLATVQDLTKRLVDSGAPIDVLLNNAGVMATPEMKTQEGYEFQLGVNHLGHFALTAGLMPLLTQHERYAKLPRTIIQFITARGADCQIGEREKHRLVCAGGAAS